MAAMSRAASGVFTYQILKDRERKNLAILELIQRKGPISRAEISRVLGLNIVTVTNYTDYYIAKNIIMEVGYDVSSGGRRPELLELSSKNEYVAGVDIGPTSIAAVICDLKLKVLARAVVARPPGRMEDIVIGAIKAVNEAVNNSGLEPKKITNIGIGISGIVDYPSATIHDTDPKRGRTKISFSKFNKAIEDKFGIPVHVGNDASCAAFGERALNPAADAADNILYLYSDVGCGMIVQGDVYIGSSGCAGETQLSLNNTLDEGNGSEDEFRLMKPLGVDLGVVAAAREEIQKGKKTKFLDLAAGNPELITKEMIIKAALAGDEPAGALIGHAGKKLGIKIAYMVNLFNPSLVIIGGGMEKAGDILFDPLKASVKKFAFEEPSDIVKIMPSFLGEDAVVLGSAALTAREVFIKA